MKQLVLSIGLAACCLAGCDDRGQASEQKAVDEVDRLIAVLKTDVQQVRTGLPAGAKKLGTLLDADPGNNLPSLQRAIAGARASVPDLAVAKSTFFSFADPSGVVLRSEADPDLLAQKAVFGPFPDLARAKATEENVEAFGEMQEMRGVRTGPDAAWVVAHGVRDGSGKVAGVFVTGWSFRRYAYRLEEQAKRDVVEAAQQKQEKRVPIVYAFALRGSKAYGAPVTPDVNVQAIDALDLGNKLASGLYRATVEITGRKFGIAAKRTPELSDTTAIAVLVSDL
jgi:hypothetical protein